MYTSGRQHGFVFYYFKMVKDFRRRSNKCYIVDVEIKEWDLRELSLIGLEDSMGWIWHACAHLSLSIVSVT